MDRYIIREPRTGTEYPQGNQMIAFSTNAAGSNNIISPPDNVYYRPYGAEFSNMQRTPNLGYMGFACTNSPQTFTSPTNLLPGQGQVVSGIDPRYLAGYSDNSTQFIIAGQTMQGQNPMNNLSFGVDYQNHKFVGPDRNNMRTYPQKILSAEPPRTEAAEAKQLNVYDYKNLKADGKQKKQEHERNTSVPYQKPAEKDSTKNAAQTKAMSRLNKLDVLYKRGLLVFSGPVEKVLKWHKSLQDIGVLVLYEVVAKCVSVRPGESCAKNLVVRDENGPAMQVVYYEIDFLLPELKPPCTVRVVGRMMVGTCRLQAFNVRPATGDDVAMLSRRAAVSAHHIAKLCKEYGNI